MLDTACACCSSVQRASAAGESLVKPAGQGGDAAVEFEAQQLRQQRVGRKSAARRQVVEPAWRVPHQREQALGAVVSVDGFACVARLGPRRVGVDRAGGPAADRARRQPIASAASAKLCRRAS